MSTLVNILREAALQKQAQAQSRLDSKVPRSKAICPELVQQTKFYRIPQEAVKDFTQQAAIMNGGDLIHVTVNHIDHGASYQLCKPTNFQTDHTNQEMIMIEMLWFIKGTEACEDFKSFLDTFRRNATPL